MSSITFVVSSESKSAFNENTGINRHMHADFPIDGATVMAKTVLAGFDGSLLEKPMPWFPCYHSRFDVNFIHKNFAILFNISDVTKDRFYRIFAPQSDLWMR